MSENSLVLPYRAFGEAQLHSFAFGVPIGMNRETKGVFEFPNTGWEEFCGILSISGSGFRKDSFRDPNFCRSEMRRLDLDACRRITEILCSERWTHVPKMIAKHKNSEWELRPLKLEELLSGAGDLPNGASPERRLEKIVSDPKIVSTLKRMRSYRQIESSDEVFFDTFVGVPRYVDRQGVSPHPRAFSEQRTLLIDGNHRAIMMARQIVLKIRKNETLKIVVPIIEREVSSAEGTRRFFDQER